MLDKPIAVCAAVTAVIAGAGCVITASWQPSPRVMLVVSCEDYWDGSDANSDFLTQQVDLALCAKAAKDVKDYWDAVREGMRPPSPKPKTLTPEELSQLTEQLNIRPGFGPIEVPGEPEKINPADIPRMFMEGE